MSPRKVILGLTLAFLFSTFAGCGGVKRSELDFTPQQEEAIAEHDSIVTLIVSNQSTQGVTIRRAREGTTLDCGRLPRIGSTVSSFSTQEFDVTHSLGNEQDAFWLNADLHSSRGCDFKSQYIEGPIKKGDAVVVVVNHRRTGYRRTYLTAYVNSYIMAVRRFPNLLERNDKE